MSNRIIPLAGYAYIQYVMHYNTPCVDIDDLASVLEPLGEKKFFALLNCLIPLSVERKDLTKPPVPRNLADFMLDYLNDTTHQRKNPMDPRNMVDWERMHRLVMKHDDIHAVVSLLLNKDLRKPETFYTPEVLAFKNLEAESIERTSIDHTTYVKCPVQEGWLSEPIFHQQFYMSCIGVDEAISHDRSHGLVGVLLDDAAQWLKDHDGRGEIQISLSHFDKTIAYGTFQDNQISWKFASHAQQATSYKTLNAGQFLSLAHDSANKAGLNHRKKNYLSSALDL